MSAPFLDRIAELDAISRQRALTYAESLELEREITFASGQKLPKGLTRALARQGIKRRMQRFNPPASQET
jgi:hypothetical protein